jgi:thioredoxin reductase (NADPH)
VYYGAGASEALLCCHEHVFVVGGGNSAGQAAMHFSTRASKVTVVIRGDGLKQTLSQYLVDRILASPDIEVLPHTEVTALHGDDMLRAITLTNNQTGQQQTIDTSWLFLCLGGVPRADWADEHGILRDEARTWHQASQACGTRLFSTKPSNKAALRSLQTFSEMLQLISTNRVH